MNVEFYLTYIAFLSELVIFEIKLDNSYFEIALRSFRNFMFIVKWDESYLIPSFH